MIEPGVLEQGDPPIRLGIGHLLLWTACSGLLLSAYQLVSDTSSMEPSYRTARTISHVLHSLMSGASVASLAMLVYRRANGRNYPVFAGHWVLIVLGAMAVIHGLLLLFTHFLELMDDADMLAGSLRHGRVVYLAHAVAGLGATMLFGSLLYDFVHWTGWGVAFMGVLMAIYWQIAMWIL